MPILVPEHQVIRVKILYILTAILWLFLTSTATGQDNTVSESDTVKKEKKVRFLALPVITYAPETRLRFGASGLLYFRTDRNDRSTQLSTVRFPITYTLNKQFKFRLSYDIFLKQNQHIFSGFQEWFKFPLLFWGIGANTPDSNEELFTTSVFAFNLTYLNRITEKVYVGAGYDLRSSKISDKDPDGQLAVDGLIPGSDGGTTAGFLVVVRRDVRDNNLCPGSGSYLQARIGYYNEFIGSDFNYTLLEIDYRKYIPVFQGRHLLALQFLHSNNAGEPGFETMALLGGDEIMRGHYEGRFRDNGINAAQVEYRLPLGRKKWIDERKKMPFFERFGLVGFVGTGHVYPNLGEMRWDQFVGAYGFGFRWLAIPEERINIRIDIGFGTETPGFYFQIREAF